jgi:hypothetical protein
VHLSVEVICEAAIVIEATEVCATDVADLEFLVARGPRRIGQRLQLALALRLGLYRLPDPEELVLGAGDFGHGAEDLDFQEAIAD